MAADHGMSAYVDAPASGRNGMCRYGCRIMSSRKREKARYADRESAGFGRKQGGTAERISSLAWIFRKWNIRAGVFCFRLFLRAMSLADVEHSFKKCRGCQMLNVT